MQGVQQIRIQTESDGTAQWDFDPAFPGLPFIAYAIQDTDPQPYAMSIVQLNAAFVRIQLYHAQTLPALILNLSALFGFNIFGGGSLGGVTVHLIAMPPQPGP